MPTHGRVFVCTSTVIYLKDRFTERTGENHIYTQARKLASPHPNPDAVPLQTRYKVQGTGASAGNGWGPLRQCALVVFTVTNSACVVYCTSAWIIGRGTPDKKK